MNMEARIQWQRWRNISDRIIKNPHYAYNDPQKWFLFKLADFAKAEMGRWNTLAHGPEMSYIFPRRFAAAHLRRCPNLPKCIYGEIA